MSILVGLADHRLSTSTAGRLGSVGSVLVVLVSLLVISASSPGQDAAAASVSAASWLLWLGAGPALLTAAGGQPRRDREDGIDLLVRLRGHSEQDRSLSLLLATAWLVARRVGGLGVLLCVAGAARAESFVDLGRRVVGLLGFALTAGLVLGALARACDRLGARRASSLLLLVVVLPWLVAPYVGHPAWSIPGVLDFALSAWTGTEARGAGLAFAWGHW